MDKDELIQAQTQVIGILFEVVKRMSENSTLDEEYVTLALSGGSADRMSEIRDARQQNADVIARLLRQLEA
ncbi:MAG: hydrolase [Thaumarchaeota archaeon]|nr:hydrolase [Nitrososphaerota archaeon]